MGILAQHWGGRCVFMGLLLKSWGVSVQAQKQSWCTQETLRLPLWPS